ncbi:hypothetical protein LCGC14_1620860 [marine sediment metagenome]|uniref:Uncharacterized protein n=1 Tax=marine sediment metagenome TaxID=412755 RepID=A0A0F9I5R7_9ZZZZ
MTDQPAAQPTTWVVQEYDGNLDCARVVDPFNNRTGGRYIICNVFAEPSTANSRAKLFAAAPATAAERDRLKVALQQAEEGVAVIVGQISAPQDGLSPETTAWVVRQAIAVSDRARAALIEARKP